VVLLLAEKECLEAKERMKEDGQEFTAAD